MPEYKRMVVNGVPHYGKHMIAHVVGCNDNLLSKDMIAKFCKDLVPRIDMVAFGEPFVERFGAGVEVGISAVQLIHTSAITIHTNDGAREMYLDVFSCKDFEEKVVVDVLNEMFSPTQIEQEVFLRR